MTPNTQSVCKYCGRPIKSGEYCRRHRNAEPVSEPASTGEPQLWDCYSRESGILLVGRIKASSADEAEGIGAREIYADKKDLAARPSEPYAPQTSAEPTCGKPAASLIPRWGMSWACALQPNHEGECAPGGNCVKHGKYICKPNEQPQCPEWPDCISAAAPQPVSGDAPKVEELESAILKTCCDNQCELSSPDLVRKLLRPYFPPASQTPLKAETWEGAAKEYIEGKFLKEIAAKYVSDEDLLIVMGFFGERMYNMGYADALTTSASTARTSPAHFSDCDYDCSCGWKKDPDSHLGAVRD